MGIGTEQRSAGITFEAFLAAADEDTWAEWVDGEVVPMTPVSERHSRITVFLTTLLNLLVARKRLGQVLHAPFYMKTGEGLPAREPDVLFVATENVGRIKGTYLDGPADLVVEVISPESRGRDRGEKHYEYEKGGVREYWLIDPIRPGVELYVLGDDGRFHSTDPGPGGRFESRVVDGLWLDPEWLWREPIPDPWDVLREWGLL
ncbi:MAG: hypothetical protein JWM27_2363 [Gemmatimonadetes bacterium]|nr:hypothetical protein [Gemmatimonadota bacterium]